MTTLRGPVLDREGLRAHAADVAATHGRPTVSRSGSPVRDRFSEARAAIESAYAHFASESRNGIDTASAEEWLLDNRHVVERQLRGIPEALPATYLRQLPRVALRGSGSPRIYLACLDYIRHTDGRLDPDSLSDYIEGYQAVTPLTIGELWAVPIMLRLGLLLVLGSVARGLAGDHSRERATAVARDILGRPDQASAILAGIEREGTDASLLVYLWRALREHEASSLTLDWIRSRADSLGASPEELAHRMHLQHAGDQLAVANAIGSLRAIDTYDWTTFFERTSVVENILSQDSGGVYSATDAASRDRCRHTIERIARQSQTDEATVAKAALRLARRHPVGARSHVAYYLTYEGRFELERECGARLSVRDWMARTILEHPRAFYFGLAPVTTVALWTLVWLSLGRPSPRDPALFVVSVLLVLAASEVALSLVGSLVVAILPPRLLNRLSLEHGIPEQHRTLVAVPVLFDSIEGVDRLVSALEIRALANPDERLHFALLSDFTDAPHESAPGDDALVERAVKAIASLNARYSVASSLPRYSLFHRKRVHNEAQGCFMGWERKRGKLEELNRLILGKGPTTFTTVTAPPALLSSLRYVLTVDADTELPRTAAMKLVATIAHPLNRPVLDADNARVVGGYAVIQPRVGTVPSSAQRSRFAHLAAGPAGLDPYTTAVSDVYQDLFGEGSYIGKAIYDVRAFAAVHDGRIPDNRLLSHDLFEGILARTALATDIEVLDEQPSSYGLLARRAHRWIRGDWQLLALLGRSNHVASGWRSRSLRLLGLWKIADNLRRSLLGASSVLALLLACAVSPVAAPRVALVLASVVLAPIVVVAIASLLRRGRSLAGHDSPWPGLRATALNALLGVVLLFDQSIVALDAIARTLYRLLVSKTNLLEWQSTGLDRSGNETPVRMWVEVPALAAILALIGWRGGELWVAAPMLGCWILAPLLVDWLSRPLPPHDPAAQLGEEERRAMRRIARKTWHFFESFVTAEDHWLPPDNFQEEPRGVIAHRTSPTNIGLYLLSVLTARELGYIGTRELARRISDTLDTLERLDKHEGHALNWYDTTTLQPLEPRYVSTVDSGNLLAYLWTVHQACEGWVDRPLLGTEALDGVADALGLAGEIPPDLAPRDLAAVLDQLKRPSAQPVSDEWRSRAEATRASWREDMTRLAPHLGWIADPPGTVAALPAFLALRKDLLTRLTPRDVAEAPSRVAALRSALAGASLGDSERRWLVELFERLERAATACEALTGDLRRVAARAWTSAGEMRFRFLFDADRSLFSIGYNVSTARLDSARYDLLASEARLASFVAIAKGDVPEKHWFHLGRARRRVGDDRVLLSWSGSMFEYLMPLLVLRSFPDSLLDETHRAAVRAQQIYGRKRGVPWGISEAAFNVMDLAMTYQYRAFGVPSLGLKPGLDDDCVVAPYATALAAMVEPEPALRNYAALAAEGLEGRYGFYDSIDYTPSRVPPQRRGVAVKTYMAHHQAMSLVAMASTLLGAPLQRTFHSIPRVKATELLLQERIPTGAPLLEERRSVAPAPTLTGEDLNLVEVVGLERQGLARVHLLGHGELTTMISSHGTGALTWRGLDINRFREDQRVDPAGCFLYLRDRTTGEVWSTTFEPSRAAPSSYGATFSVDHVEIRRRDGDIEATVEIAVSPEHAVEIRRLTLVNHGERAREIEVTAYTEVVLAPRAADVAHRAFSNMFVEFEQETITGALVATRRPQPGRDLQPWLVQTLVPESHAWGEQMCASSRADFIGRGQDLANPRGLEVELKSTMEHPLDPALVLRRQLTLEPQATARLSLVTGIAGSREEALALARAHGGTAPIDRAFELARADARVELRHLGLSAAQSFRFQRLLSFVVAPHPSLRSAPRSGDGRGDGQAAVWSLGISGDLPLVVVRVDGGEVTDLCRELLLAHEFFRLNNFAMDLLLLSEEPAGYLHPVQDELLSVVQSGFSQGHLDQRGGVFVRRSNALEERDYLLVLAAARVVLRTSAGSLARQLRLPPSDAVAIHDGSRARVETSRNTLPRLVFDNGMGGFTHDGREYVVYGATPAPWSNVLANPTFGTLVTERGGGFTWSINSQRRRLSPWTNDAVSDPIGEAIYLFDESGRTWKASDGIARHAAGRTTFEGRVDGLRHTLSVVVPPDAPVKLSYLALHNEGPRAVTLRVCGYVEWVLGASRESTRLTTRTEWDSRLETAFAENPGSSLPRRCSFFRATRPVARTTSDRGTFFADFSTRACPAGVGHPAVPAPDGPADPCAALEVEVALAPGETTHLAFVLGDAADRAGATALATQWGSLDAVEAGVEGTRTFWEDTLEGIQIETPDPALDILVNRWLLPQVLACRMWGRSAFYQSGGAFGFRDQLQDALALIYSRPDLTREHLILAAARQFEEGDVQHWWHAEDGAGIRTRCSDDMLWLAFATMEYLRVTQDRAVLDEPIPFLTARALAPEQHDVFSSPHASAVPATLYEHCARAIDNGLTVGPNGLPLMRGGDWNDGMDRVGSAGRGESVWLAWFLLTVMKDFAELADSRGDAARAARLRADTDRLARATEAHAWDGEWYRRGTFDDGSPLGSSSSRECQIDAIAQSWAVLAGAGDPSRARRAVEQAEARLMSGHPEMMKLLTPPFAGAGPDPGYIRAYPPGIRENGGQYTHGALWTVQALAMMGEGARAHALLSKLNPIQHATTLLDATRYAIEPYVLAGDVYSAPEHEGRGGWSWYTGAAGWMYRIAVQWLLGLHIDGKRLSVRPCVPPTWSTYTVRLRRGRAVYEIVVRPGLDLVAEVDGRSAEDAVVDLVDDGSFHSVQVRPRRADQMAG